jgi:cell division protein FtsW (lipid II flippase)
MALGPIRMQPAEFAKIGLLLALARHLSTKTVSLNRPGSLLVPGLLILVPFVLVLRQPDLGTAMVFSVMAVPLLFWAGLSLSEMFLLISPGISLVLSLVLFLTVVYFSFLKTPYSRVVFHNRAIHSHSDRAQELVTTFNLYLTTLAFLYILIFCVSISTFIISEPSIVEYAVQDTRIDVQVNAFLGLFGIIFVTLVMESIWLLRDRVVGFDFDDDF